jgi:serine/threonine protein kinase/formylglycine-generating enzyme required for sulfatase activity
MSSGAPQAKTIADNALTLAESERTAYVLNECKDDEPLKESVLRLIALALVTKASSDETLDAEPFHTPKKRQPQLAKNDLIGNYRIVQKLGEGGFGEVYHARQFEPVRRDVAVKILKRGMDSHQVLVRFQVESQAMAMMSHPGIAKVFDAGVTDTGQPYFVMELVKGVPITHYCDLHRLDVRSRVKLFIDVCQAIQHAHHKGVIHRDIKPSNILVAERDNHPVATVIDFGVAKATQQQIAQESALTQMHQIIGTPVYMSPEQAEMSSLDIDTRADVYSLGVVLYELLSGCLPFSKKDLAKASVFEIIQLLREVDPVRPSTLFGGSDDTSAKRATMRGETPRGISKLLRSELDWITMKCLEKDRSKRYASVSGLAGDAQRFLDNEPVLARRNTFAYTLQKFASKHRGMAITTALVFASLAIGLIASLYLYRSAQRQAHDVLRLSDLNEIMDMQLELDRLVEADFANRPQLLKQWKTRVKEPLSRADLHRETLARLTKSRQEGGFEDKALEWQFKNQSELVRQLKLFEGPEGLVARIDDLIERSPSTDQIETNWDAVEEDFSKKCPDWMIKRTAFLFPLGVNPETQLWEFVDLRTGFAPKKLGEPPTKNSGIEYVLLNGGTFNMGSPEQEAGRKGGSRELQHAVTVSPFLIAKYETTQAQWYRIGGYRHDTQFLGELLPTPSSWFNAREFGQKLTADLPTDAQWEFACRAGTEGPFSGTGRMQDMGWFDANSGQSLHPIGLKRPNQFGLFDMHGNAHEWVLDHFDENFYSSPEASQLDPLNPPLVMTLQEWTARITQASQLPQDEKDREEAKYLTGVRSGVYNGKEQYCRSADRWGQQPNVNLSSMSFRLAITRLLERKSPASTP